MCMGKQARKGRGGRDEWPWARALEAPVGLR